MKIQLPADIIKIELLLLEIGILLKGAVIGITIESIRPFVEAF